MNKKLVPVEILDLRIGDYILINFHDKDNIVKSTILFNLNDPNTYRSIKLLPNSQLFFADINWDKIIKLTKKQKLMYTAINPFLESIWLNFLEDQ